MIDFRFRWQTRILVTPWPGCTEDPVFSGLLAVIALKSNLNTVSVNRNNVLAIVRPRVKNENVKSSLGALGTVYR